LLLDTPAVNENLPVIKRNTLNKFTIFQRLAHFNENNTYTLRIVTAGDVSIDSEWIDIITVNQNVTADGVYFDIEADVPADLALGHGVLQLIFDATVSTTNTLFRLFSKKYYSHMILELRSAYNYEIC
jgi:hypothetical protein